MSASETLLGLPVPVPVPIAVKFYLVAPPAPGDLAGLVIVANGSPLGTPGAVTVRPSTDPAGVGLNIAFSNLPNQYLGLPIAVDELKNTFRSPPVAGPLRNSGKHLGLSRLLRRPSDQDGERSAQGHRLLRPPLRTGLQGHDRQGPDRQGSPGHHRHHAERERGDEQRGRAGAPRDGAGAAPAITIVFPASFALTLSGRVDLAKNTTTFTNLPDIPLTDLKVTLAGGPNAVFATPCVTPSGIGTATLTSQNGDKTAVRSSAFSVSNCTTPAAGGGGPTTTPPGPKPSPTPAPKSGAPRITSASLAGLARGKVTLRLRLVSGQNAPPLQTFTIQLPRGLRFIRHRVHRRLKLEGVSVTNSKLESLALPARQSRDHVAPSHHELQPDSARERPEGELRPEAQSQPSSDREADADRGRHRRHGQDHRVEAADQEPASMTAEAP